MKKLVPIPPESLNRLKEDDLKDFGYQFVSIKLKDGRVWVIKMLLRIKIKRLYPSGEYRSCLADISWGILLMSGAQG
jgi:hypothetical protein